MDLYRTLRVSLYLLVGSGAFAISVAERSLFFLALSAALGLVAYYLIDRGRIKPLSAELTAALTLVLLFVCLRPMRDDEQWREHIPATVAHFLCAWQGLLFFSVYCGPVLLTFCGLTLVVVVMSGVIHPGASLVLRLAVFVGLAVWTLYIHALWRARQEFAGRASMLLAGSDNAPFSKSSRDDLMRLPEQAFWGTVRLVFGMALACLMIGTFLFFTAPRLDGMLAVIEKRGGNSKSDFSGPVEAGRESDGLSVTGLSGKSVRLEKLGKISEDSRAAMKATFSKPVAELCGPNKLLLLKSASLSEYSAGQWQPDMEWEAQEGQAGAPLIFPRDPSLDGPSFSGEEVLMSVESGAMGANAIFSGGPVLRVGVRKLEVNREGALRAVIDKPYLEKYTLKFGVPLSAERVPPRARAEHRDLRRYVLGRDVGNPLQREALENLARQITQRVAGDAAKALTIAGWLRENCSYTTDLQDIHPEGDPLAHFLLSRDKLQRRGHCGLFASAFVMLCRMNNLPARLCTGFAPSIDPKDKVSLSVIAKNSDAHAWAEIYYKNIGWVPYDPTPPALEATAIAARSPVAIPKVPAPATEQNVTPAAAGSAEDLKRGFFESVWSTVIRYDKTEQRRLLEKLSGTRSGSGESGWFTGKSWTGWLGIGLLWGGLGIAIFFLVQMFTKRGRRKRFPLNSGGGRARAAVAFYNDMLQALSKKGFTRKANQTPREFAEAVVRRGGLAFAPAREITEIFETVRYGGGELAQDEFNRLQEALDRVREMTF